MADCTSGHVAKTICAQLIKYYAMWHTKCRTCTCMPDSFCFSTPTLKNDLYMYVEVVRQGPNPNLFYWMFDRKHSP